MNTDPIAELRQQLERVAIDEGLTETTVLGRVVGAAGLARALAAVHAEEAMREAAQRHYCGPSVRLDDNAELTRSPGGVWVGAWLWVTDAEIEKTAKELADARVSVRDVGVL